MPPTEITRRDHATRFRVASDQSHEFRLRVFHLRVLELEDAHFHLDSAVLLADYDTDDPQPDSEVRERVTALVAIAEGLKYARAHPAERTLVAGHTDTSGSTSYNLPLSNQRARSAMSVIMGDRQEWVSVVQQRNRVEDYQLILKWVARDWGWDCDPGPVDNQLGQGTRDATSRFQQRYNQEFNKNIGTHGNVDAATWGAFFDVYQTEIRELLDTDDAGLAQIRANLQFADAAHRAVGCGEHFPIEARGVDEFRSRTNRRVEWMFFDPAELPLFECHPGGDRCLPDKCEVNNPRMFIPAVIPVAPVLPRRLRVRVNLRFAYRDPVAGQPDHPFPEQCPVTLVFGDGSANQVERMQADGRLAIWVDKRKRTMAVQFDFSSGIHFFGSATPATTRAERELLVPEAQLGQAITDHYNVFELPQLFTLGTADWPDKPATVVNDAFDLNAGNVGTSGTPQPLTLDPHWQHLKFLYFDRRLKQKLSILPIVIEGFFKLTGTGAATDTDQRIRSQWATDPQACQCMPWILRKRADGTALTHPDQNCALRFRTQRNTFIDSTGGNVGARRLVTGTAGTTGGGAADPSVASGVGDNRNFGQPNAERLSFYDLPEMWRSRGYFTHLSGGTGAPAAAQDVFENLANRATTDALPLIFSLDDIILTDATLAPVPWNPSVNKVADRVAIFSNTFAEGPRLSSIGLYDADTRAKQSYFSITTPPTDQRNYIADYPDWTRLVVAQGNFFDVFDRRTPEAATGVVGARAGVRWADSASIQAPGADPARPAHVQTSEFAVVQPFFEQRHDAWWTIVKTDDRGIGRFDLGLFRCCDLSVDGTTEISQIMTYFRFALNFKPTPNPTRDATIGPDNPPHFNRNPAAVPLNLVDLPAAGWIDDACTKIAERWRGDLASSPPTAAVIAPEDRTAHALESRSVWFVQNLPRNIAHFEMGVFRPTGTDLKVRAYMSSNRGYGSLDQSDNQPSGGPSGRFTAAHETGHGGSLGDEYVERSSPSQPGMHPFEGFDSNMPGGAYSLDGAAMMVSNRELRARYFWHLAEWMRFLYGFDFVVEHNGQRFKLPHLAVSAPRNTARPYMYTHVNWPLAEDPVGLPTSATRFDAFLYPLGDEDYGRVVLPGRVSSRPLAPLASVSPFDGILVILVRLRFNFHSTSTSTIDGWLKQLNDGLGLGYNFKFMAAGTAQGHAFSRCLLHFSPRYHVPNNFSPQAPPSGITPHFTITTNVGNASSISGANVTLGLNTNSGSLAEPIVSRFRDLFGTMLGLAAGTSGVAASYDPIVQRVIPGANTTRISS